MLIDVDDASTIIDSKCEQCAENTVINQVIKTKYREKKPLLFPVNGNQGRFPKFIPKKFELLVIICFDKTKLLKALNNRHK